MNDKSNPNKNSPYLVKLFRGEVSLPITYWVFGVLIGNIGFLGLNKLLELNFFNIASHKYSDQLLLAYNVIVILLTAFILIAIWRSAKKYDGPEIWKNLARIAVIIGAIKVLYGLYSSYGPVDNYAALLKEEVKLMNKSLPTMIDSATRLDRSEFDGDQLKYFYTLVLASIEGIKIDTFSNQMKNLYIESSCDKDGLRPALEEGLSVHFIYFDKNGKEVTKILISSDDCK